MSAMSRVAVKNEIIARRTTKVVEAHGLVTGVASRLRVVRHGHLFRTCATRYRVEVATLRSLGVQQSENSFLMQPAEFNLTGQGFAGDLLRHAPHEGNYHSFRHLPCISSRKAFVAAMWDIIRCS